MSKLPSACAEEQFVVWKIFKSFESFWIFCKNLWHGSQFSIFVSRVKIAEEIVFLFFFSEFFRNFSEKFFWLLAKKFEEVVKTNFCVCRRTIFGLNFFLKFWIFLDFLQKSLACSQNSIYVSSVKIAVKKGFFLFFFSEFFRFLSDIFSDFCPKHFKSFPNYLLHVQRNHLCL